MSLIFEKKYLPTECNDLIWTPVIHDMKNQRVDLHFGNGNRNDPLQIMRKGHKFVQITEALLFLDRKFS